MTTDQSDRDLAEWTQSRTIISGFDDRLDGLRKAGFSLVATLLTAEGLLLPGSLGGTSSLPDSAKFAVLFATLLLVLGMEVVDRIYRGFQDAAASRAIVLEQKLNLEITENIQSRFPPQLVGLGIFAAYGLMGAAVVVLGGVVLDPNNLFYTLLVIFAGWLVATQALQMQFSEHGPVDWSLGAQQVDQSDPIEVTLTNLAPADRIGWSTRARIRRWRTTVEWKQGQVLWRLEREGGKPEELAAFEMKSISNVTLPPRQNFVWRVKIEDISPRLTEGVYQIRPCDFGSAGADRLWSEPLRRKIIYAPPKVPVSKQAGTAGESRSEDAKLSPEDTRAQILEELDKALRTVREKR